MNSLQYSIYFLYTGIISEVFVFWASVTSKSSSLVVLKAQRKCFRPFITELVQSSFKLRSDPEMMSSLV